MADARDHELMARALVLAENAQFGAHPNPAVGCVIVADGRIVGEGWTAPAGGPHAERVALAAAGAAARGATAYVTLEPCNHHGRTPPCTDALIEASVARVVYAVADPDSRVTGGGARALDAAGIRVEAGVLEREAEEVNRGFFTRMRHGRPYVRSKLGVSLDGRTALADGRSQWITGEAARADVQRWRARSGAILTGVGTVLADDPSLSARFEHESAKVLQPLRAIVDSTLRTPPRARTLQLPGEVVIFAASGDRARQEALEAAGARVIPVAGSPRCDLHEVIAMLAALDINDVWVEAGPTLNGALLDAGLIDELIVYMAPRILGADARGMFAIAPLAGLDQSVALDIEAPRKIGNDWRFIARPIRVAAAVPRRS
jgi:diaminohydroxyphosphoribosylaminopyrimidine deaminase / 5-amino-6-(5-phosphoribosylamino)uracil reductase